MSKKTGPLLIILIAIVIGANASLFTVDETRQAIVVQLGKPVSGIKEPGLHFKIPFIQEVIYFESRLMDYDASPAEILTMDKKNLVVDNYAKWKIIDPLTFYTRVRDVRRALERLDDIIFAELRVELGRHVMSEIISEKRPEIMDSVTKRSDAKAKDYGISVADVRIKRADLPEENERAVFGRMRAEREREAMRYRSEGREAALKLKASADRERTIILAEAYRISQKLRGDGDAEATRIYAAAFEQDPEFFSFLRTLDSYGRALNDDTVMVLSQDDEFLDYFKSSGATMRTPPETEPGADEAEPGAGAPEPDDEADAPPPAENMPE